MDDLFRTLLVQALPRLRRFSRGLTGSPDRGDDLMQAAAEKALRYAGTWQAGTSMEAWLFRIARNHFLNDLRAQKVRGGAPEEINDDLASDPRSGARAMEARLDFQVVQSLLAELPEEQRAALLLVCVEGLSYGEAADVLDLPVNTLTSRLGRARAALRARLDEGTLEESHT